jgi:hypothetical protein
MMATAIAAPIFNNESDNGGGQGYGGKSICRGYSGNK